MDGRKTQDKMITGGIELTFSAALAETEKSKVYDNKRQST
jgi:hypothetical protein